MKESEHYDHQLSYQKGSIKLNESKLYKESSYQEDSGHSDIVKNFLVRLELTKIVSSDLR
jgi:hypothetical protein